MAPLDKRSAGWMRIDVYHRAVVNKGRWIETVLLICLESSHEHQVMSIYQ